MIIFEIISGLVLFSLLSLISFIILPSIFGCFGFLLFLGVFLALVVTFSVSIGWFIFFALISYLVLALIRIIKYYQLPNYEQYLTGNLNVYLNDHVHCSNCGGDQLMHNGLFGLRSKLRYYICTNCRKQLYRFKVVE